jgi:hypothetical protein
MHQSRNGRRLCEVVDETGRFIDERPIGAIGGLGHTSHGFSSGCLFFFSWSIDGRFDDSMADLFKMVTGDVEVGEAIGSNLALFGNLDATLNSAAGLAEDGSVGWPTAPPRFSTKLSLMRRRSARRFSRRR